MNPIGTAGIVIDLVVPDSGTLSFSKSDHHTMTNVVGDGVILHNSIARGVPIIIYAATISIDRTVSKRETFSSVEVNTITTVASDRDILDVYI